MAKLANKRAVAVEFTCWSCGEALPETHSGSHTWDINEVPSGTVVSCACGASNKLQLGVLVRVSA